MFTLYLKIKTLNIKQQRRNLDKIFINIFLTDEITSCISTNHLLTCSLMSFQKEEEKKGREIKKSL